MKHEPWCDSLNKMLTSLPPQPAPCNCTPAPAPELKINAIEQAMLSMQAIYERGFQDGVKSKHQPKPLQEDPLARMWEALAKYQPYAEADGHGASWSRMCTERTKDSAWDAGFKAPAQSAKSRLISRELARRAKEAIEEMAEIDAHRKSLADFYCSEAAEDIESVLKERNT